VSSDKKAWLEGSIIAIAGQSLAHKLAQAVVASRTGKKKRKVYAFQRS